MDAFMENIVKRKKTGKDYLFSVALYLTAIMLTGLTLMYIDISFGVLLIAGLFYGAHWISKQRSWEFEISYTNGDIDIDRIVAQRKRKRIFSQSCREFEMLARVGSAQYTPQVVSNKNVIDASSGERSDRTWFALTRAEGKLSVLYFEPSNQMIDAMAVLIPRKLFR